MTKGDGDDGEEEGPENGGNRAEDEQCRNGGEHPFNHECDHRTERHIKIGHGDLDGTKGRKAWGGGTNGRWCGNGRGLGWGCSGVGRGLLWQGGRRRGLRGRRGGGRWLLAAKEQAEGGPFELAVLDGRV